MKVIESQSPIVIPSYCNCEIYCCHLDGYKSNREALLSRLSKVEAIILSRPAHARFRVWYNMDENRLDERTMKLVAESIARLSLHTHRIAFIGLKEFQKWRFNRLLKQALGSRALTKAYFSDAELAKGWLV